MRSGARAIGERLAHLDAGRLTVFFLLLLPAVAGLRSPLGDPDLWWHLEAGEWILEHRAVPWEDSFSYTAAGRPWIAYSWLAEVVFYGLADRFGYGALVLLKSAALVALTALLYLSCRAAAGRRSAVLISVLAVLATQGAWAVRPQLFSLVLLALLSWALRSPRVRRHLPWIGPLAVGSWANLHMSFFLGFGLLGLAAVCASFERLASRLGTLGARPLWAATGLAGLATLANPYGWHLLGHVPTIVRQPQLIRAVEEFRSPDFASSLGIVLAVFLLVGVAVIALSRERMTAFELLTFLGPLAMGLYMVRNMAIFAILAAPTLARLLDADSPRQTETSEGRPRPAVLALHYALVLGALVVVAGSIPLERSWQGNLVPGRYPVAAADFVAQEHPRARLFSHFNWGGFLIFRLYPGSRVAIDGRTNLYDQREIDDYLATQYLRPGWEKFLQAGEPDLVLWPARSALAVVLRRSREWRIVYEDEVAVVFRKAVVSTHRDREAGLSRHR